MTQIIIAQFIFLITHYNNLKQCLPFLKDYSVGRINLDEFKQDPTNIRFGKEGMLLFQERFRRVLGLHSEFSHRLSDLDRSALWRSNFLLAGALCLSKVIK